MQKAVDADLKPYEGTTQVRVPKHLLPINL